MLDSRMISGLWIKDYYILYGTVYPAHTASVKPFLLYIIHGNMWFIGLQFFQSIFYQVSSNAKT